MIPQRRPRRLAGIAVAAAALLALAPAPSAAWELGFEELAGPGPFPTPLATQYRASLGVTFAGCDSGRGVFVPPAAAPPITRTAPAGRRRLCNNLERPPLIAGTFASPQQAVRLFASPTGDLRLDLELRAFGARGAQVGPTATGNAGYREWVRLAVEAPSRQPEIVSWEVRLGGQAVDDFRLDDMAVPPDTSIVSSSLTGPSFTFGSDQPGVTFQCSVDGSPFAACAAETTLTGIGAGTHVLAVRALDAAGNADPSPASQAWAVDPPVTRPPEAPRRHGRRRHPGRPPGQLPGGRQRRAGGRRRGRHRRRLRRGPARRPARLPAARQRGGRGGRRLHPAAWAAAAGRAGVRPAPGPDRHPGRLDDRRGRGARRDHQRDLGQRPPDRRVLPGHVPDRPAADRRAGGDGGPHPRRVLRRGVPREGRRRAAARPAGRRAAAPPRGPAHREGRPRAPRRPRRPVPDRGPERGRHAPARRRHGAGGGPLQRDRHPRHRRARLRRGPRARPHRPARGPGGRTSRRCRGPGGARRRPGCWPTRRATTTTSSRSARRTRARTPSPTTSGSPTRSTRPPRRTSATTSSRRRARAAGTSRRSVRARCSARRSGTTSTPTSRASRRSRPRASTRWSRSTSTAAPRAGSCAASASTTRRA